MLKLPLEDWLMDPFFMLVSPEKIYCMQDVTTDLGKGMKQQWGKEEALNRLTQYRDWSTDDTKTQNNSDLILFSIM